MASYDNVQYVRLRNLTSSGSSRENEAADVEVSVNKKIGKSIRGLHKARPKTILLLLSLLLNIIGGFKMLLSKLPRDQILTYSPALKAVRNERVVFSSGFGIEQGPFQGEPNDRNNKLWADLYDFAITRVSAEEAKPMDNKTLPVPDGKGGYVIQLAVFHQLHCLNLIRKGIYGAVDMSNKDDLLGIEHLDHCIDMLRQAIMCNSDVTPTTFARKSLDTSMKVVAEVVHTCRSFSKIQQWAWNRRIKENFDKNKVIIDDPLGWGTYTYVP